MSCKRRMDGLVARLENVQAGANLSRTLVLLLVECGSKTVDC